MSSMRRRQLLSLVIVGSVATFGSVACSANPSPAKVAAVKPARVTPEVTRLVARATSTGVAVRWTPVLSGADGYSLYFDGRRPVKVAASVTSYSFKKVGPGPH